MRYVVILGGMFVAGGAIPGDYPDGRFVELTRDPAEAHDFLYQVVAAKWLARKGLPGKIIGIGDDARWLDVTHAN